MEVVNIHERELSAKPGEVGALLDSFAPREPAAPDLSVSDVTLTYLPTAEGTKAVVPGQVTNRSCEDATHIWFRLNILGGDNRLLDTLPIENTGLVFG